MFTKSKLFSKILAFVYFFFVPLRDFMKLGEVGRKKRQHFHLRQTTRP